MPFSQKHSNNTTHSRYDAGTPWREQKNPDVQIGTWLFVQIFLSWPISSYQHALLSSHLGREECVWVACSAYLPSGPLLHPPPSPSCKVPSPPGPGLSCSCRCPWGDCFHSQSEPPRRQAGLTTTTAVPWTGLQRFPDRSATGTRTKLQRLPGGPGFPSLPALPGTWQLRFPPGLTLASQRAGRQPSGTKQ